MARPVVAGPHEERLALQRPGPEIDRLDQQLLALELEVGRISVWTVDFQNVYILVELPDLALIDFHRKIENIQEISVARLFFGDVLEDSLLYRKVKVLE